MTQQRRDFLRHLSMAAAGFAVAAEAAEPDAASRPMHDMSAYPTSWTGDEQIAMLLYPGFTALDFVGPHHMLSSLMGAKVHLVARTKAPVPSDSGLAIAPTLTLAWCPKELDVLFVPGGGEGTLRAMRDKALVRWIADHGAQAKLVAAVCTGSMILGQAGLLRGKWATTHWATQALLKDFGAQPIALQRGHAQDGDQGSASIDEQHVRRTD